MGAQLLIHVQGQVSGHCGHLLCGFWSNWHEIWYVGVDSVPHEEKWVPNCFSMFRAKLVYMEDTSSVGFGPIGLKFCMWAWDGVPHEEKWEPNCYSMFRAKSGSCISGRGGGGAENQSGLSSHNVDDVIIKT